MSLSLAGQLKSMQRLLSAKPTHAIGLMDFSYAPFALGDTITWMINAAIVREQSGLQNSKLCIVLDPDSQINPLQPHMNHSAAVASLAQLSETLDFFPGHFSLHFLRSRGLLNTSIFGAAIHRQPSWPSFMDHLCRRMDYNSHKLINRHFKATGRLPWLKLNPRQTQSALEMQRQMGIADGYAVVNIRQRHLSFDQSVLKRDSPIEAWMAFIREVAETDPGFRFVLTGQYLDWPRELIQLPNIVIPRTFGYGLGEELTLLLASNFFMGTSSGFAAAATFSEVPYLITNYETAAAVATEIPVGATTYPFARPNQTLSWCKETKELLLEEFRGLRQLKRTT